ncbi:MAG: hypothetical protein MUE71_12140 [Chitinophagaceae bacterium]|jgi:hypothetical protein|nr:hypothetical protein [Chitinophagaceae bacterium]
MRLLSLAITIFVFSIAVNAQNFEPAPSPLKDKLENALKRYGTIEQIKLSDPDKKTFTGKPGKEYFSWVVYSKTSTAVRRMMIIEQGPQGEKIKIHYPRFNQAITDADNQAFAISFVAPEGDSPLTYRVDASPEATVYLYEITRGFKRDLNTKN